MASDLATERPNPSPSEMLLLLLSLCPPCGIRCSVWPTLKDDRPF